MAPNAQYIKRNFLQELVFQFPNIIIGKVVVSITYVKGDVTIHPSGDSRELENVEMIIAANLSTENVAKYNDVETVKNIGYSDLAHDYKFECFESKGVDKLSSAV